MLRTIIKKVALPVFLFEVALAIFAFSLIYSLHYSPYINTLSETVEDARNSIIQGETNENTIATIQTVLEKQGFQDIIIEIKEIRESETSINVRTCPPYSVFDVLFCPTYWEAKSTFSSLRRAYLK